jgi:hypothetical protein
MNNLLFLLILLILIFFVYYFNKNFYEKFNIPLTSSSAWDWNLGEGYGAGYGTGYAMWGVWPGSLPKEPWKNWMWARRPLIFINRYTPVPQIDYNNTPNSITKETTNYSITLLPYKSGLNLAVNGFPGKTLQLDRNRLYFFQINLNGATFAISDGKNLLSKPISNGILEINFDNNDPEILYYINTLDNTMGGIIYLNKI